MDDLYETLEQMQLCESLSDEERDLVERCLDEGYEALDAGDKSTLRRCVNRHAARRSAGASPPMTRLQRVRALPRFRAGQTPPPTAKRHY